VGEALTIEWIFEIDEPYHVLVRSLEEGAATLDSRQFGAKFDLGFVAVGCAGKEIALTPRGRAEKVTLQNYAEFIALANEFRIRELSKNLEQMREGLWENLGIAFGRVVDWQTLEFAACGDQEISTAALVRVTRFQGVPLNQIALFWEVVKSFTAQEVFGLLKFATGRMRLPPSVRDGDVFLKVDGLDGVDRLPRATTCTQTLHYPTYSSFEKARQMMLVAITFTGSFELH
jgi:E3 ubiquitin-protein ligase HUWE1